MCELCLYMFRDSRWKQFLLFLVIQSSTSAARLLSSNKQMNFGEIRVNRANRRRKYNITRITSNSIARVIATGTKSYKTNTYKPICWQNAFTRLLITQSCSGWNHVLVLLVLCFALIPFLVLPFLRSVWLQVGRTQHVQKAIRLSFLPANRVMLRT